MTFFDFSKELPLPVHQRKAYFFLRAGLYMLFFLLCFIFLIEILLPHITYRFDATIHSLANTITRPERTTEHTRFSVVATHKIDKARLRITLDTPHSSMPPITVYKSYGAFLYPINTLSHDDPACDISPAPFHMPYLLASKTGVFVTSYKKIHPFDTVETFRASGYDFDQITHDNDITRSAYTKAKILTMESFHPPQTIFHTQKDNFYCVRQDHTIQKIPNPHMSNVIAVDERSRHTTDTCNLIKSSFSSRTYHCTIPLTHIKDFPGKRYTFEFPNIAPSEITAIKITLATEKSGANLRARLHDLYNAFIKHYNI